MKIWKRWVGRKEKQIALRLEREANWWWWRRRWQHFRPCLYLSLFSWTAGRCLSRQCHHFWQWKLPPSNTLAVCATRKREQENEASPNWIVVPHWFSVCPLSAITKPSFNRQKWKVLAAVMLIPAQTVCVLFVAMWLGRVHYLLVCMCVYL